MKTIKFQRDGKPFSDYEIGDVLDNFLASNKRVLKTSTHLLVDEVRARIATGHINMTDIRFLIDGEYKNLDSDGRSNDWYPSEETGTNILMRILKGKRDF